MKTKVFPYFVTILAFYVQTLLSNSNIWSVVLGKLLSIISIEIYQTKLKEPATEIFENMNFSEFLNAL